MAIRSIPEAIPGKLTRPAVSRWVINVVGHHIRLSIRRPEIEGTLERRRDKHRRLFIGGLGIHGDEGSAEGLRIDCDVVVGIRRDGLDVKSTVGRRVGRDEIQIRVYATEERLRCYLRTRNDANRITHPLLVFMKSSVALEALSLRIVTSACIFPLLVTSFRDVETLNDPTMLALEDLALMSPASITCHHCVNAFLCSLLGNRGQLTSEMIGAFIVAKSILLNRRTPSRRTKFE